MTSALTIVTYHYVRPIASSPYPRIKGLELDSFRTQLDHLERHYQFVTVDQVVAATDGAPLPERPVLLTFDDGYADHARHVFPILEKRGIQGAFFAPSAAVLERRMLDVNKIHFVLASAVRTNEIVKVVERAIAAKHARTDVLAIEEYRASNQFAGRWDPPEVVYLKRLLQQVLPEDMRTTIVDELFRRFVTADATAFADDLYVSLTDLRDMVAGGMHIGAHGHSHAWLDSLDERTQADEIDRSIELLAAVGLPTSRFTFCYPYGRRSATTVALLQARGCVLAVTTDVGIANLRLESVLELPRIDTNDLPVDPSAPPSTWTAQAGSN